MPEASITVRRATREDVDVVAPLFDGYRQFYGQPPALQLAREFVSQRLERAESIVLLAQSPASALGFCQLYPSFSSVALGRVFILNDLFVAHEHRRQGVGAALLRAATDYGRSEGAVRITLSTAVTNAAARTLYEASGWMRQTDYHVYSLRP